MSSEFDPRGPVEPSAAPLRGRAAELAMLTDAVEALHSGIGGIVLVGGAAGVGKSRLLAEAARIAGGLGIVTASARADELDQATAWGTLLRALGPSALVPAPAEDAYAGDGATPEPGGKRRAFLKRLWHRLEEASASAPILICLDDLQWSDPATLSALATLPAKLFSSPITWFLAYRPTASHEQLADLLARLRTAGAQQLLLEPLDRSAAAAIAHDVIGPSTHPRLPEILEAAEGNPFHLIELLRTPGDPLWSPVPAVQVPHTRADLPDRLSATLEAYLRVLPEPAYRFTQLASVFGLEFSFAEVASISGRPFDELAAAVDHAVRAEVLVEEGGRLAFRHDLIRQAAYAGIPLSARRALHRDAAQALRTSGASAIRVAGHFSIGAWPGDDAAIDALTEAMSLLADSSALAATDLALRILELLDEADPRRSVVVGQAVALLGWAGRSTQALELGEEFLAGHRLTAMEEARLLLGVRVAWISRRATPYPKPLPDHVIPDPAVPATLRAMLIAIDQLDAMWNGRYQEADRRLRLAADLAAEDGSGTLAEARTTATIYSLMLLNDKINGRHLRALDHVRAGAKSAESLRLSTGQHQYNIAAGLHSLGRLGEALTTATSAQEAAETSGHLAVANRCQWLRSNIMLDLGRLDDARAEARTAADVAEDLGLVDHLELALYVAVEAALRQGDLETAGACSAQLESSQARSSLMAEVHLAIALYAESRADLAGALSAIEPVLQQISRGILAAGAWNAGRFVRLTRLCMRTGAHDRAALVVDAAARLAKLNPGVSSIAGFAAHARGLLEQDVRLLAEAVDLLAQGERPLATADAREDYARLLADGDERSSAIVEWEAALDGYSVAGAERDCARIRRALRAHGHNVRPRASSSLQRGWGGLTETELNVVRIVAQGRTNRDVAAAMFLSPDTINTHLRHAFTKLNVRSRVELTRLVAQEAHSAWSHPRSGVNDLNADAVS